MKYSICLQSTCWLIQYLNYIDCPYDKESFYRLFALNRFIRYNKLIKLIKLKKIVKDKKYLIETLISFEGSIFDIQDLLDYEISGELKKNLKDSDIILNNDKTLMMILEMYDNHKINKEEEIIENLYQTFGNLKFLQKNSKKVLNVITFDDKLKNYKYILRNSNVIYKHEKYILNQKDANRLIMTLLNKKQKILISLDNSKALYKDNKLMLYERVNNETLKEFVSTNNHYYIIIGYKLIEKCVYYKAYSGYDNEDKYVFLSSKYIKSYINHILCDTVKVKKTKKLDIFKYMEGEC